MKKKEVIFSLKVRNGTGSIAIVKLQGHKKSRFN
jgi:hypothetical protein